MSEEKKNNNRTLEEILKDLSKNIMFRMGGKELSHSDFLAWVIDTYKGKCCEWFGEKIETINREKEIGEVLINKKNKKCKADICINDHIIIENKFKSQPDKTQLENYRNIIEKFNNKTGYKIILLSFFPPSFNIKEKSINAEYWSYNDLKEKLKKLVIKIQDKIQEKDEEKNEEKDDLNNIIFINKYIEMIDLLYELKGTVSIDKKITYGEMINKINHDKVKDISQKFNFHETLQKIFLSELTSSLLQEDEIKGYEITPFVNYTSSFGAYADLSIIKDDNYYIISFLLKPEHIFHREIGVKGLTRDQAEPKYNDNFMFKGENISFLSNTKNKRTDSNKQLTGFWGFEEDSISWLYKRVDIENSKKYKILEMKYEDIKNLVKKEFDYITKNLNKTNSSNIQRSC